MPPERAPVREISYLDFELDLSPAVDGVYPLRVIRSPIGEARATLALPFDVAALATRLPALTETLLQPRDVALAGSSGARSDLPPEAQSAQALGRTLFDALLPDDLNNLYDGSVQAAAREGKGLRIKLRIAPPELATLPWEYLYDRRRDEYVCLSRGTPVVRYIEQPQPIPPLQVATPLRILGVVATPSDLGRLDVAQEQARLESALTALRASGTVELHWLENPTWRDLQRTIWQSEWHIFHFIGHGGFDTQSGSGLIALTNEAGLSEPLSAQQLARLLGDHGPLRLALLNACQSARSNAFNLFGGTAVSLVQRGTPAVVAMQYPISDGAAIEFARTFYEALAAMIPIDAAVAEARKAISFTSAATTEWGVPVLFMRSADGVIFTGAADAPPAPSLESLLAELNAAGAQAEWDSAIDLGRRILTLDPAQPAARARLFATYIARGQRKIWHDEGVGAQEDFEAALALDPQNPIGVYWRGLSYDLQGDHERAAAEIGQAVQQLTAALEREPQRADYQLTLGECYLWQRQYDPAIAQLTRAIELGATTAEAYTARGRAYEASNSFDLAIADLTRAIELSPQIAEAYAIRSDCFNHQRRYEQAVADLSEAIKLDPDNDEYYITRASSFYTLGDNERAIADLTRALEIDPRDAQVYYLRGVSYHQAVFNGQPIGDYERAIADFTQAIALDAQDADFYAGRANSLYQSAKLRPNPEALTQAIADFTQAIALEPQNGELYYARGLAYNLQRDRNAAQRDFKQAVDRGYARAKSELDWWRRLFG